jgi:hypothetical protein
METIRDDGQPRVDERLGEALSLLQKSRRARPGYVPLLAGCAFIGAATFLAYVVTKSPALEKPVPASTATNSIKTTASKADFELSGTPASAEPPVAEAVILGTEQSR